jgi:catechol 2,3-dioxygenase-like lactoylglutathione lyase family enzyme
MLPRVIKGAHVIIYSKDAEADRAFFRDTLKYPYADAGQGWLIFALPPAEVAVHPTDGEGSHELYLMCEDVHAFVERMRAEGRECTEPEDHGWGVLTNLTLPGGGKLGVYQPRHASPLDGVKA